MLNASALSCLAPSISTANLLLVEFTMPLVSVDVKAHHTPGLADAVRELARNDPSAAGQVEHPFPARTPITPTSSGVQRVTMAGSMCCS